MNDWIDYNIIIDFKVPKNIEGLMQECEKCAKDDNWGYFEVADTLDEQCKYAYTEGIMTKKQWTTVVSRYRYTL